MLETTRPYGAPVRTFISAAISFGLARESWQLRGYWEVRREIFCRETALFASGESERDVHDEGALAIVATAAWAGSAHDVVGVVRIYAAQPGVWYGGRLGVSGPYRTRGKVGSGLIETAVGTAKGRGCERFLASVLLQNGSYFERHHFRTLEPISVCGRPHLLMQADLRAFSALGSAA